MGTPPQDKSPNISVKALLQAMGKQATSNEEKKEDKVRNPERFKRLLEEALAGEAIEAFTITPSDEELLKTKVVDEKLEALKPQIRACFSPNSLLLVPDDENFYYQFMDMMFKAKKKEKFVTHFSQVKPRLKLEMNEKQFVSLYQKICDFEELCRILYL